MKKFVKLFATLLILALITACGSSSVEPAGTLTIGTPPLTGDFVAGWSNSSYDVMVRDMIYGYPTYDYTDAGEFVLDETVVKEEVVTENSDGSKTYTFTIHDDLKWSNGEGITAKDFVFGLLVFNSPEFADVGGSNTGHRTLVGWENYAYDEEDYATALENGQDYDALYGPVSDEFAGVVLVDDYTFSMTIKASELPYFYEVTYVSASPSPMAVWAPGADIEHGSSKVTFGGDTADMTAVTNYVSTVERFAPTVSSGMYKFVSYEQETVILVVNENYKGDYRGHKPTIENIEIKRVNETLDVDYVLSGDIDITTGVVEGDKIEKAKAAVEAGTAGITTYERNGYGFLGFHNDVAPVNNPDVRQAFAHLVDREIFVNQILGGYGVVVNGEYGLGQWMYKDNAEAIEVEDGLINYVYDPDRANEILDGTEWKFEADGVTPFDATKAAEGYYRHNANGDELRINHAGSENNEITDLIATDVVGKMHGAGINFVVDYYDFNVMLEYYYQDAGQQEEAFGFRKYHTFNLASGFTAVYDPYYSLHSDYYGLWQNSTKTNDPVFDELVVKLRSYDPSQKDEYSETWLEFQKYWNSVLPVLPLYSNQYYDIYSANLENVNTTPFYGLGRAVIDIRLK